MAFGDMSVLPAAVTDSTNQVTALRNPLTKDVHVLKSMWLHYTSPLSHLITRQVTNQIPIRVIHMNHLNILNSVGILLLRRR